MMITTYKTHGLKFFFLFIFFLMSLTIQPAISAGADPENVTEMVQISSSNQRSTMDRATRQLILTATVTVSNTSDRVLAAPVHAVFTIAGSGVTMPDAQGSIGSDPYGTYYYDISSLIPEQGLAASESVSFNIKFVSRSRFTYEVMVYGVLPVENRPPQITSIPAQSVNEGSELVFTVSASDPDTNDSATLSADNLPPGASFDPDTAVFSWTPEYQQAGNYNVTFTAEDNGGLTSSIQVNITVADTNRNPVFTSSPILEAIVNDAYSYTVHATDPDNNSVTYSLEQAPEGMSIDPSSGVISWMPVSTGNFSVEILAQDPNQSTTVQAFTIFVESDTVPLAVSLTYPADGAILPSSPVNVTGTSNDPSTIVQVNDYMTRATEETFTVPNLALQEGSNQIRLVAMNFDRDTAEETRTVILDSQPPVILITRPAARNVYTQFPVTVSGFIQDATAVTATINEAPLSLENNEFETEITPVTGLNTVTIKTKDQAGHESETTINFYFDDTQLTVESISPADNAVDIDATSDIHVGFSEPVDPSTLNDTTFYIKSDSRILPADIEIVQDAKAAILNPSESLPSGAFVTVVLTTGIKDATGNPMAGNVTSLFSVKGEATQSGPLIGTVFDNNRSQPLALANINVIDTDNGELLLFMETDEQGSYFCRPERAGVTLEITKPGYTTVYRKVNLVSNDLLAVQDARLTPLAEEKTADVLMGSEFTSDDNGVLTLPPGIFPQNTPVTLTSVSGQGPAIPFPSGWRPLSILDIRSDSSFEQPLTWALPTELTEPVTGKALVWARFDDTTHTWIVFDQTIVPDGTTASATTLHTIGQYAALVADTGNNAPPAPVIDQALTGGTPVSLTDDVTATGQVVPEQGRSDDPTPAHAIVKINGPSELSSGTLIKGEFIELVFMRDGTNLAPPDTAQDLVAYRDSADTTGQTLIAGFPITASKTFDPAKIQEGTVTVNLSTHSSAIRHLVDDAGGGIVTDTGRLTIPQGALGEEVPVTLNSADTESFPTLSNTDIRFLGGFDLDLFGEKANTPLGLTLTNAAYLIPSDGSVVVARVQEVQESNRLVFVGLARINGTDVTIDHTTTGPGILESGRYGFYQIPGPVEVIQGTAREKEGRLDGHLISVDTLPFVSVTDGTGTFVLAASPGAFTLTAVGSTSRDLLERSGSTDTPLAEIVINPTPPLVTQVIVQRPDIPGNVPGPIVLSGSPGPVIDDDNEGDSKGNGNGIVEAGETIELTLTVRNEGTIATAVGNILLEVRGSQGRLEGSPMSLPIDAAEPNDPVTMGPFLFTVPDGQNPSELRYSMFYTITGALAGTYEVPFTLPLAADHIHIEADSEVVAHFSEPVTADDPQTGMTLYRSENGQWQPVEARVLISTDGMTATLRPVQLLQGETTYKVSISDAFKDADNRPLINVPHVETFRTRDNTPPEKIDPGRIVALVPDEDGKVLISGTPGSVNPDDFVILLNETSGASLLAQVYSDGSFGGQIPAWKTDPITIILRDRSDNQTRIPISALANIDPATGEIISAIVRPDGGTFTRDGINLIIPDGALGTSTEVSVSKIDAPFVLPSDILNDPESEQAFNTAFTPYLRLELFADLNRFNQAVDLEIPAPDGSQAGDLYLVVKETEVQQGGMLADMDDIENSLTATDNPIKNLTRLEIVETATVKQVAGGELVISTDSPPFKGVLEPGEYTFLASKEPVAFIAGSVKREGFESPVYDAAVRSALEKQALDAFSVKTDLDGAFVIPDVPQTDVKKGNVYTTGVDVFDPYFNRTVRKEISGTSKDPAPKGTTVVYLDDPLEIPASLGKEFVDVLGDIENPYVSVEITGTEASEGFARVGQTLTVRVVASDNDEITQLSLEAGNCSELKPVALSKENTYTLTPNEPAILTFKATAKDALGNITVTQVSIRVVGGEPGDKFTADSIAGCAPMLIGGTGSVGGQGSDQSENGSGGTGSRPCVIAFSSSGGTGPSVLGSGSSGTGGDGSSGSGGNISAQPFRTIQLDSDLSLDFSEPLDPGTLDDEAVQLLDPEGARLAVGLELSETGNTVIVKPKRNLRLGARYELHWNNRLRDLDGNIMLATPNDLVVLEVEPPRQVSHTPLNNARDLALIGSYLAVLDHPDTRNQGDFGYLIVYKIRDDKNKLLEQPEEISRIATSGHPYSLAVDGSTVYVVNQYLGKLGSFTPAFSGFGIGGVVTSALGGMATSSSIMNSSVTGISVMRNALPNPVSNIESFDLCDPYAPQRVTDPIALSKDVDRPHWHAFTDPTAWNPNAWPIRVEVENGMVGVLNSHENIQIFNKKLELIDTIESVGGVYTYKGRCRGGSSEGRYCESSIYDLFGKNSYCGAGGTCEFAWEFLNAAFFDGYAVSVERAGIRIVRIPKRGSSDELDKHMDHTLVPKLPQASWPLEGTQDGISFVEGVSDFEWIDDQGVQHVSDLCFISMTNGKLKILMVKDAVRQGQEPDAPLHTSFSPFTNDHPRICATVENKAGTMSVDKQRGILYSIPGNGRYYAIDIIIPTQPIELNNPGNNRSEFQFDNSSGRISYNGIVNHNGELFLSTDSQTTVSTHTDTKKQLVPISDNNFKAIIDLNGTESACDDLVRKSIDLGRELTYPDKTKKYGAWYFRIPATIRLIPCFNSTLPAEIKIKIKCSKAGHLKFSKSIEDDTPNKPHYNKTEFESEHAVEELELTFTGDENYEKNFYVWGLEVSENVNDKSIEAFSTPETIVGEQSITVFDLNVDNFNWNGDNAHYYGKRMGSPSESPECEYKKENLTSRSEGELLKQLKSGVTIPGATLIGFPFVIFSKVSILPEQIQNEFGLRCANYYDRLTKAPPNSLKNIFYGIIQNVTESQESSTEKNLRVRWQYSLNYEFPVLPDNFEWWIPAEQKSVSAMIGNYNDAGQSFFEYPCGKYRNKPDANEEYLPLYQPWLQADKVDSAPSIVRQFAQNYNKFDPSPPFGLPRHLYLSTPEKPNPVIISDTPSINPHVSPLIDSYSRNVLGVYYYKDTHYKRKIKFTDWVVSFSIDHEKVENNSQIRDDKIIKDSIILIDSIIPLKELQWTLEVNFDGWVPPNSAAWREDWDYPPYNGRKYSVYHPPSIPPSLSSFPDLTFDTYFLDSILPEEYHNLSDCEEMPSTTKIKRCLDNEIRIRYGR